MMKFRNLKKFVIAAAAVIMAGSMAMPTYATVSYERWYENQYGYEPDGALEDWVNDPVYYVYLEEVGDWETWSRVTTDYSEYGGSSGSISEDYGGSSGSFSSSTKNYADITDAYWSGKTAKWDLDGRASKYQVVLYRDGKKVTTKEVTSRSCSFSSYIDRDGDYSFEVRPYNKNAGGWQDWEDSDEQYFKVSSSSGSSSSSSSSSAPTASSAKWVQASDGTGRWWYRHADGSFTKNNWEQVNGKWYFFDGSGWMKTGWLPMNGATYYLAPDGAMVTGNYMVNGSAHNFDGSGRMVY